MLPATVYRVSDFGVPSEIQMFVIYVITNHGHLS